MFKFVTRQYARLSPGACLKRLWQDETGQDLIEYALVAALLALAAIASIRTLGTKVAGTFTTISTSVTNSV